MRPPRGLGAVALIGLITTSTAALVAEAAGGPNLATSKNRYRTGQTVVIRQEG